jgi:hypothetical protein
MPEKQSAGDEWLSGWRRVVAKAHDAETDRQRANGTEAPLLRYAAIVIWVAGLSACGILAWHLSAGSFLLTGFTLLIPGAAWRYFGLSWWGLLLPLSLIGLLALQGAVSLL